MFNGAQRELRYSLMYCGTFWPTFADLRSAFARTIDQNERGRHGGRAQVQRLLDGPSGGASDRERMRTRVLVIRVSRPLTSAAVRRRRLVTDCAVPLLPRSLECLRQWCRTRRQPRCPLCQASIQRLVLRDGTEEVSCCACVADNKHAAGAA